MSEPGFDPLRQQPYQQPPPNAYPQQPPPYAQPLQPYAYPPPQPDAYPQPYAHQQKPGKSLRVAGEVAVLVTGSVLMVVVGGFAALFSIFFWYGISNPSPGASDSGAGDAGVIASILFPGPLVALVAAWVGYAVFSVLKRRAGGLIWFSAVVLAWLLAFTAVLLQVFGS